jgi:hypothetical protein
VGGLSLAASQARNLVVTQVFVQLDSVALADLYLIEFMCLFNYLLFKASNMRKRNFLQTCLCVWQSFNEKLIMCALLILVNDLLLLKDCDLHFLNQRVPVILKLD